jgi:hypothetical protein
MNKNPASRASRLRSHFSMGPNYPRSSGR